MNWNADKVDLGSCRSQHLVKDESFRELALPTALGGDGKLFWKFPRKGGSFEV
jgi:hypothetical protein